WNGTLVADVERAWNATRTSLSGAGLDSLTPGSIDDFRDSFTLPMGRFFQVLGVPASLVTMCVAGWNAAMADGPAVLAPGAQLLLEAAATMAVPVVVVSGADAAVVEH